MGEKVKEVGTRRATANGRNHATARIIKEREQENDMRHNGVRPGCTCREHMPEGCHTERCLSAQCIQYNNNLLSPATKEDISHSMDFPGNF